jgi:hypothetical protein
MFITAHCKISLAPAKKLFDNEVYGTKNTKFQARDHKKPTSFYKAFFYLCVYYKL